jgi:2-isopropylmalate synthase
LTHDQATDTECTVRITARGETLRVVGEGNGPVNALDHALRNALLSAYPAIEQFELVDYRVRILDQGHGTDATVRVLIQTSNGLTAWTTVGVGQNIIEASWEALCEAYVYGLLHTAGSVHSGQSDEATQGFDPSHVDWAAPHEVVRL